MLRGFKFQRRITDAGLAEFALCAIATKMFQLHASREGSEADPKNTALKG